MCRTKLKKIAYQSNGTAQMHDRRATDLPFNSVVAIAEVDDPYSDSGEKLTVVRSIRDDPLAGMLARNQIDQAQFSAGRLWQKYHEQSEIGGVRAIDPTKEAVDGGTIPQLISDQQIKATKELANASKELGTYDNALIWLVLGERVSLTVVAQRWCMFREREKVYLGARFRDALETLATLWNFIGKFDLTGKSRYRPHNSRIAR